MEKHVSSIVDFFSVRLDISLITVDTAKGALHFNCERDGQLYLLDLLNALNMQRYTRKTELTFSKYHRAKLHNTDGNLPNVKCWFATISALLLEEDVDSAAKLALAEYIISLRKDATALQLMVSAISAWRDGIYSPPVVGDGIIDDFELVVEEALAYRSLIKELKCIS